MVYLQIEFSHFLIQSTTITSETDNLRKNKFEIRRNFMIEKDDFIGLSVCKFIDRENPLELLKAFNCIGEPKTKLILIGDGPLKTEIMNFIELNGLSDRIILTGYQPYSNLPKFYSIADCFIHPPKEESWGISVNEAAFSSLPIIASSKVGAAFDMIINGKNSYI